MTSLLEARARTVAELQSIDEEIHKERLVTAKEVYGLHVGAIVIDSHGRELLVREIQTFPGTQKPWVKASKPRDTGGWYNAIIHLFNEWEVKRGP
jgi:hypothetical protein